MSPGQDITGREVRVGVTGYWGPNLARNFASVAGCELAWCCDADAQARIVLSAGEQCFVETPLGHQSPTPSAPWWLPQGPIVC